MHFQQMLARYRDEDVVEDRQDHEDLVALLGRYDEFIAETPTKTGCGIDVFFRRRNVGVRYSTSSFWVRRTDGTETDFSYRAAVQARGMSVATAFTQACRMAVQADIAAAKRAFFRQHADAQGRVPCELTGTLVTVELAHVDHAWPTFAQLVDAFRSARGWLPHLPAGVLSAPADAQTVTTFIDPADAEAFRAYHHPLAQLRIVGNGANLAAAARQRRPVLRRPLVLAP